MKLIVLRLTALFLATKTTNNPISLERYTTRIPKTAPADVLDLEFLVAQSLGFEFAVWHAHRALWGIWLDIQVCPLSILDVNSCLHLRLEYSWEHGKNSTNLLRHSSKPCSRLSSHRRGADIYTFTNRPCRIFPFASSRSRAVGGHQDA
jgi:hypothetical protein